MIISTTDFIEGYRILSYLGVYHYRSYDCSPEDAINGMEKEFYDKFRGLHLEEKFDKVEYAMVGVKLTQLTNYEPDGLTYYLLAYGTGVVITDEKYLSDDEDDEEEEDN